MALKHAEPGEVVSLAPPGPERESARTAAIVRTDAFEAVRLIIARGTSIPSHKVAGQIMLHCLEGHVVIGLEDRTVGLQANDWVYLDGGAAHSVRAIENSAVLLTILFPK